MFKKRTVRIEMGKVPVFIKLMKRVETGRILICPICRKGVELYDDMYMLSNNYKLFPNAFIHKKCTKYFGYNVSTRSADSWDEICNFLTRDYLTALSMKENFKCWLE